MTAKQMIGLVGSPRANSTSEKLATFFTSGLAELGWQSGIEKVGSALRTPERWSAFEAKVRAAEVVVLAFPLYVDALPAETTLLLERLANSYQAHPLDHPQRWLAIINCGFYESEQNDIAAAICRQFTVEAGVTWCGALTIGGGGMLQQQQLKAKGMLSNMVNGFEQTITALHTGSEVPESAFALVSKPLCSKWLYFTMANLGMKYGALANGKLWQINAQPYAK